MKEINYKGYVIIVGKIDCALFGNNGSLNPIFTSTSYEKCVKYVDENA